MQYNCLTCFFEMTRQSTTTSSEKFQFLSGGGEMGKLMRSKDWSTTSLGSPDQWPQSLKTTLNIVINSRFPMFLWWGSELTCFYNDAYRPSLGQYGKHPQILGEPAKEAWTEIWPVISPLIDHVLSTGEATWMEDQLIPIYRNGKLEDVYWTFSYSPVIDESGDITGVLVTCTETTEKIHTYKKLEESKDQLHFAIEAAELGTWDYNPLINKFTANARLKSWFGLSPENEIELDHAINAIAEKDRQRTIAAINTALDYTSGGSYDVEYSIINPATNQEIIVKAKGKAWFNEQKLPIRFNGTLENVTEQVEARRKIEESEFRFRTLIEEASLATGLYIGRELKILYANDILIKVWGKTTDVIGKTLAEAVPELKGQPFLGYLDNVYTTGEPYIGVEEKAWLHVDGKLQPFYFDFTYKPLRDLNGKVYGIHHMATDVTEKVKWKTALQESEKRFRNTVEQVPVGITILRGPEFIVEMANETYLQIVDRQENKFVGRALFDSLPEAKETVGAILTDVLATGIPFRGVEFPVSINRFGKIEISYFNFVYQPLREDNGDITGIIAVATDVTPSVKAKHLLAESESQFRNMVMQSPIPMTIIRGENFIIETVNKAMLEDVWQKSEADTIGLPLLNVFPELREQKYADLLNQVFITGEAHREKEAAGYIKINGEIKKLYFDFEYAPLFETDNSVSGLIITINDVTEKVEARLTIEASEQRLRSLVESAPFPIAVYTGLEMRIQFANQSVVDIWGKGNDIIGRNYATVLPELANQGIYEQLEKVYTTAIPFHAHNQRVDLMVDNKIKSQYFNYSFTPLFDITGKVYGIMNTAADVTDLVISKQKVEESEKEFRQLADSLPELVWTTDSVGTQLFASRRWKEFTGLDPYDAETFDKMVHPDDRENVLYAWTVSLASGVIYKTQVRLKSKEGEYQWFYVHGEPIRNDEGKIEKWVGSFTNLNDQKKAEEELISAFQKIEESEKRFRNVANSAPVFIWMAGNDKKRYFFNTAWFKFTGRTLEQERGDGWIEGVHPDDKERCFQLYDEAFTKQQEYQMEYRLRRFDGEYRWISARGVPRFGTNGIFEGLIGACMDIHEQVIAQKKLKEEEERLNIIVKASDLGTWELNLITMEVIYSGRYIEIFGYDKDTHFLHKEILAHLHPDDLPKRKIAFENAMATGVLYYESRIIAKDKSIRWVENKGKVFYDEQNQAYKIIGTTRDTTEEKNYEQQLLEREQKFRLLADSMPQLVWTGDAEGNLNYFSRAVYDYSGLTPEQIEKDGWLQLVHPADREENVKTWKHAVTTGTDFIFEHRFGRHDGVYRWQLSRAIPQRDANGKIQMWVGTSTDIQDMKEQDQQKDFFISMASHELKTPITSIKGYVQILQGTYQKSEDGFLKNSLRIIDKQIATLTNLISDLLDVSKIKSGNLLLNKEDFCITALTQDVITEITHINPDYDIHFLRQSNVTVHADKGRIGQVLINFLTNAVKYSPKSKKITVESYVEDGFVIVSVEDSGIGINKADQEKIFERFYRVEGKNEKTFPGFGIGLFIAAEIIKRHNGKIWVKSEPDKGSVFFFSLPLNK